jgi:hypothetical protein
MADHRRQTVQHRDEETLSPEDLAAQEAAELPDREAMSLLGGGLFSGGLPAEGADLLGGAPAGTDGVPADSTGAPSTTPDLSSSPIPFKNPLVG